MPDPVTRPIGPILVLLLAAAAPAAAPAAPNADDVAPRAMQVLGHNCVSCHSAEKHKGGLVLSTHDRALQGGKGGPALVPGSAGASRLLTTLAADADPHMPPQGQLKPEEIEALRAWVEAGAAWDEAALAAATAARPGAKSVELRPLPDGYRPVMSLAVSPDGKKLAAGRGDEVVVYDLVKDERAVAMRLATPRELVYSLAWSADGKWLAAGGFRTVRLWDLQSPEPRKQFTDLSGGVTALAFSPDSTTLIAGDGEGAADGTIRRWRVADGAPLNQWVAHADSVLALAMTPDGARLVSGGADRLVKVWDPAEGEALATLEGHASQVTALAVSPDGNRLASGGADREVRVWDLKTREKTDGTPTHPAGVAALAWAGDKIISACDDGAVRLATPGKERRFDRTFAGTGDAVTCAAVSPDGKIVYAGAHDGQIHAWTIASGAAEKKIATPPDAARPSQAETVAAAPVAATPSFVNDVLPLLSKAGCNAGACHAKPAGQSGFRLSVFAYDPRADYRAIVKEARGRRVLPAAPGESLLLRKPTMAADHGGGLRLKESSDAYKTLVRWIEAGMPYAPAGTPTLVGVDVEPKADQYAKGAKRPLRVVARYSDGTTRDVTALSDFSTNEKSVADVNEHGVVSVAETPGEAVVVARYMGMVDVSRVTVAADERLPDSFYAALPANNFIDPLVYERLKTLGLSPSEGCDDAEFLRRASLDVMGALPTPEQARGFLADADPLKRNKLVDRLLDDPRYADHWAAKWADLVRPNPFRAGVKSVYVLDQWLRESFRRNKPYDQLVREILLARGSTHRDGPVVVFRDKREPPDIAAFASQIFLGVRMDCARCHHHPSEKWSQEDFYQLAAFFASLKRKGQGISAPISGEAEFVWFAPGGEVKHPVTEQPMKPKALDAPTEQIDPQRDPREALAAWVTRRDNPFFARAAANRVWAELMGRGIVHPVDDFRASNPPTNGPLLDALAKDFADHGYDIKHLVRTVMRSRAYQLRSAPNDRNARDTKNFSRFYRRRPTAEVLLDAVSDVTGVREVLPGSPPDARAVQAWNYRIESEFLDAFSRPNPSADPPCERDGGGSVVQALHLMNSGRLTGKLASESGRAAALAKSPRTPREIVEELYLAAYSRFPAAEEMEVALGAFSQPGATRQSAAEDILWALLNSAEFVFNH